MMPEENTDTGNGKKGFFDLLTEIIGWLQIAVSPLLLSLLISAPVYFSGPSTGKLVIGILLIAAGLITGIIWATNVWKKKGTINYVSRISSTPELDDPEDKDELK